jgi:hypothetical protein
MMDSKLRCAWICLYVMVLFTQAPAFAECSVSNDRIVQDSYGRRFIVGEVYNRNSWPIYVAVHYRTYNNQGELTGETLDIMNNLPPASTWNFSCPAGNSTTSFQFSHVTEQRAH